MSNPLSINRASVERILFDLGVPIDKFVPLISGQEFAAIHPDEVFGQFTDDWITFRNGFFPEGYQKDGVTVCVHFGFAWAAFIRRCHAISPNRPKNSTVWAGAWIYEPYALRGEMHCIGYFLHWTGTVWELRFAEPQWSPNIGLGPTAEVELTETERESCTYLDAF